MFGSSDIWMCLGITRARINSGEVEREALDHPYTQGTTVSTGRFACSMASPGIVRATSDVNHRGLRRDANIYSS